MAEEIINRVAQSKLKTIDLEDYYPAGNRFLIDVKDWLFEGFILKEKEYREALKNHDWSQYQDGFVAITCTSDAIIPAWAFLLITTYLKDIAEKVISGTLIDLEQAIFQEIITEIDVEQYRDLPVIVKGCSSKPIPDSAYVQLTHKLIPVVKSLMYGEACSAVPLFKRRN